jgi:flagellar biosynthetic protein FlhB
MERTEMAEDLGDKTEAPTPRRRQEAREKGNIARSQDLTAASLLVGFMVLLSWYGPGLTQSMRDILQKQLSGESFADMSVSNAANSFLHAILATGLAMAPLLVGAMVIAILVNIAQVGFFASTEKLQPKLGAINPLQGFGRLFKGGQGAFSLAMNLLKLTLVTAVAYSAVHGRLQEIVMVQRLDYVEIFGLASAIIYSIAIRIGVLLLILALIDYVYQRFRVNRELRMTKQEVKEEMKRMEGDPMLKQRRRQIARQMAVQRLRKDVPTADVIVTNPTEFAVALKYDQQTMRAPRVVAKGQDYMALRIREIAIAHGVPILERKPLARALYKMVEVGQEIPEQFYSAVAEILAYVYELSGKARQRVAS